MRSFDRMAIGNKCDRRGDGIANGKARVKPWTLMALLTLASQLVACGSALRDAGATALRCPPEQVESHEPAFYTGYASGCGRETVLAYNGHSWVSPLKRASFDMECAPEKLQITRIGDRSVGITGCGKRAVYLAAGSEWVLNSDNDGKE
jgi:hypothetical protein